MRMMKMRIILMNVPSTASASKQTTNIFNHHYPPQERLDAFISLSVGRTRKWISYADDEKKERYQNNIRDTRQRKEKCCDPGIIIGGKRKIIILMKRPVDMIGMQGER
jgi:hypothetical protein